MAVRMHVTAVRDCAPEEVRAVYTRPLGPAFDQVRVHESGGWVSFCTSVWGVGASDLLKGLCELGRPALQFTTSDGCRWHLTIQGAPEGPIALLHGFDNADPGRRDPNELEPVAGAGPEADSNLDSPECAEDHEDVDPRLAFLEDPPDPDARPKSPFDAVAEDYAFFGIRIPDAFRDRVQDLPLSKALDLFREWQIETLLNGLEAAGIPSNPAAVRSVLEWKGLTPVERDSDLGNLPRLLSVLGIGGEWDDFVAAAEQQASQPPPTECEWKPSQAATDYVGMVAELVDHLTLVPVEGGPVELPLKKLHRLGFIAEACSVENSPMAALRLELSDGNSNSRLVAPKETYSYGQVVLKPAGFEAGFHSATSLEPSELTEILGRPLRHLFKQPPDGSRLEVRFGCKEERETCQRYAGTVRGDVWRIEATVPPVSHSVLSEALELAGQSNRKRHRARDRTEADALMEAVRRDGYLYNMGVVRKGLTVFCEYDQGFLATLLFRLRYGDQWNLAELRQRIEASYKERLKMAREMRRAGAEAARMRAAPHDPEPIFRGAHSIFWRSDFTALDKLDPAVRESFDETLARLGFQHVGDLVAKKQRDVVVRVRLSADASCYGLMMGKRGLYLGQEFFTRFEDDSTLTSQSIATGDSLPDAGLYYRTHPGVELETLYARHLDAIERFRVHKKTRPVPLPDTLEGVAREIDAAFARVAGVDPDA